jgi:dimethylargininase
MFTHAIVRTPCEAFANGLTTANLGSASHELMLTQHAQYVQALHDANVEVEILPPVDEFPDAHFVEDVAVVVPELAVIARPGADSRRGETALIEQALAAHRKLHHIEAPGTLDGGDVLIVGKHVMVGLSERTNEAGAQQLGDAFATFGYHTTPIAIDESLHFKSDANWVDANTLIVTRTLAAHTALNDYTLIVVPDEERYAANCLRVNERLFMAKGFPRTERLIRSLDLEVIPLPISECRKMDGGLTCMSLRL